jgi:hypothetical protein
MMQSRQRLGAGFPSRFRRPDQESRDPAADFLGKTKEFVQVQADKTPRVLKMTQT